MTWCCQAFVFASTRKKTTTKNGDTNLVGLKPANTSDLRVGSDGPLLEIRQVLPLLSQLIRILSFRIILLVLIFVIFPRLADFGRLGMNPALGLCLYGGILLVGVKLGGCGHVAGMDVRGDDSAANGLPDGLVKTLLSGDHRRGTLVIVGGVAVDGCQGWILFLGWHLTVLLLSVVHC